MTVRIVPFGGFGADIARCMASCWPDADIVDDLTAAFDLSARFVVLALWRPDDDVCIMANTLAATRTQQWATITLDRNSIQVGPFFDPVNGPCFNCHVSRRAQHDRSSHITDAVRNAYSINPAVGTRGHMPYHVRIATALACLGISTHEQRPGLTYDVDLHKNRIDRNYLIPVHGCTCDASESAAIVSLAER